MRRKRLQTVFVWRFALSAMLPIAFVGLLARQTITLHARNELDAAQRHLAQALAGQGEGFLARPQVGLDQAARLIATTQAADNPLVPRVLREVVAGSDFFELVYLVDATDHVIALDLPEAFARHRGDYEGLDVSGRSYITQARERKAPVWSDVHTSVFTRDMAMTYCVPVGQGRLLVGTFGLEGMARLSESAHSPSGTSVTVIDRRGTMVFGPDVTEASQRVSVRNLRPVAAALDGEPGTYGYDLRGEPMVGSVARLRGPGWMVMVSQPAEHVYASVRRIEQLLGLAVLLAAGLAFAGAMWMSRSLARPFQTLSHVAREVADGRYDQIIPIQPHLESESLAQAFRDMAGAIRDREQELLRTQEAIEFVARRTVTTTGEAFFLDLVKAAADCLGYEHVVFCEWEGDPPTAARTLAFWSNGRQLENITFDLDGTPCGRVRSETTVDIPERVRELFPDDLDLVSLNAECYLGTRVSNTAGQAVGHLCLLSAEPRATTPRVHQLLHLFASAAGAEYERLQTMRQLQGSEQLYRLTFEQASVGIAHITLEGRVQHVNGRLCEILGYSAEELCGKVVDQLSHPEDVGITTSRFASLVRGEVDDVSIEKRYIRADGKVVWGAVTGTLLRDEAGRPKFAVFAVQDVTQRKADEQRIRLMMAELDHRVKNNLAMVLAMMQQTLDGADSLDRFEQTFGGRVRAMAKVHESLAGSRWEGVPLERAVKLVVEPVANGRARGLVADGPDVLLPSRAALPISLTLHELATNAAKYGSLSTPEGRVDIKWDAADGWLNLIWQEAGGPPVSPPDRPGTGTHLIQGLVGYQLRGEVDLTYASEGLRCELRIPMGAHFSDDSAANV